MSRRITEDGEIKPEHKKISDEKLEELKKGRVHVKLRGDVCWELRHLSANLQTSKRLDYSSVIELLLISNRLGATLGKLRSHPDVVAILGSPMG